MRFLIFFFSKEWRCPSIQKNVVMKLWTVGMLLTIILQGCSDHDQTNESEWRQLFNGNDLTGWRHVGNGSHYVEDHLIKSHGGMGLLYWEKEKFGDCKLRIIYRMRDTLDNSGVFIRIPIEPREEWMPIHYGYEVQIDNHPEIWGEDEYHYTGTLYSLTRPLVKNGKPGPEWNTFEIILAGPRTMVYVNDSLVTDYSEGDKVPERIFDFEPIRGRRPDTGYIGLQNHDDDNVVFFKEVAVWPLSEEEIAQYTHDSLQ